MTMTLTASSRVVGRLRDGAYLALAEAAQTIDAVARERERDIDSMQAAGERLRQAWQLLDALGWSAATETPATRVELPLPEHGPATLAALDTIIPLMAGWCDELNATDPTRPERVDELELLRDFRAQAMQAVRDL
jgi:hypothetical protein